jgi:shikimate kinase
MWISLVGFMASGKSSIARVLGESALLSVIDLDAEVERRVGLSVPEIFGREGATGFRQREAAALAALDPAASLLLATGGGVVETASSCALVRARGVVFWLDAPWEVLRRRLEAADAPQRPMLRHLGIGGLERLQHRRQRLYARAAHFRLRTDLAGPGSVAREILNRSLAWQGRREGAPS